MFSKHHDLTFRSLLCYLQKNHTPALFLSSHFLLWVSFFSVSSFLHTHTHEFCFTLVDPYLKSKSNTLSSWKLGSSWFHQRVSRFAETNGSSSKSSSWNLLHDRKTTNNHRAKQPGTFGLSAFSIIKVKMNHLLSFLFSFGNSFTSHFLTGHIILIYKPNSLEQKEVLHKADALLWVIFLLSLQYFQKTLWWAFLKMQTQLVPDKPHEYVSPRFLSPSHSKASSYKFHWNLLQQHCTFNWDKSVFQYYVL